MSYDTSWNKEITNSEDSRNSVNGEQASTGRDMARCVKDGQQIRHCIIPTLKDVN